MEIWNFLAEASIPLTTAKAETMGFLGFLASLINSLAWPGLIFLGVYLFRTQLRSIIQGPIADLINRIKKLNINGNTVDFAKEAINSLINDEDLKEILKINPENTNKEAWVGLMRQLHRHTLYGLIKLMKLSVVDPDHLKEYKKDFKMINKDHRQILEYMNRHNIPTSSDQEANEQVDELSKRFYETAKSLGFH